MGNAEQLVSFTEYAETIMRKVKTVEDYEDVMVTIGKIRKNNHKRPTKKVIEQWMDENKVLYQEAYSNIRNEEKLNTKKYANWKERKDAIDRDLGISSNSSVKNGRTRRGRNDLSGYFGSFSD